MRELLRRTNVCDLSIGDHIVKPAFLSVYSEDRDGWASHRADAGTRFEVIAASSNEVTARRLRDGEAISQQFDRTVSVLKVVKV
jgi:hypothetical protein